MMNLRKHGRLAACAVALVSLGLPPGTPAHAETPARYWYDGTNKVPLYRQPQLDRSASNGRASEPGVPRDSESFQARVKRSDGSGGSDVIGSSAVTVYSTAADPRGSRLLKQGPGILFTLADGQRAERVQAWLAERGLRAEPIAGGMVFKVGAIAGEPALDLANALYESGLVQYAQPNWAVDVERR